MKLIAMTLASLSLFASSTAQATEALQMSAIEVESPFNNHCGTGRVDAVKALEYVKAKF